MRELRFTPDDLAANRNGQLSDMQQYRLRMRRRRSILVGVGILLVAVFLASGLIFVGSGEGGSPILTLLGIGVTICAAALVGVLARHWFRLSADIQSGQVEIYQGELERVIKPVTRRVLNYMIRVDGAEDFVSKEAFEVFEHQKPYAIYRTPHTGTLLAAERLDS